MIIRRRRRVGTHLIKRPNSNQGEKAPKPLNRIKLSVLPESPKDIIWTLCPKSGVEALSLQKGKENHPLSDLGQVSWPHAEVGAKELDPKISIR